MREPITPPLGIETDDERTPTTPVIGNSGNIEQLARIANLLGEARAFLNEMQREYEAVRDRKEVVPHSWDERIRAAYAGHIWQEVRNLDALILSAPK